MFYETKQIQIVHTKEKAKAKRIHLVRLAISNLNEYVIIQFAHIHRNHYHRYRSNLQLISFI